MYIVTNTTLSWDLIIHSILDLWRLQKVLRHSFRKLIAFCPLPNSFKVPAFMLRIEINERLGVLWVDPNLAKDADVNGAHELLSYNVQAMGCVHD